jgi:hypothetical protein
MTLKKQMKRYLGKKAARRVYAAMPWVGGVLAIAAGRALHKRGVRRVLDDVREIPTAVGSRIKRSTSKATEPDNELVGSH